ncbi:hypothetical protein [Ensifer canadensis]
MFFTVSVVLDTMTSIWITRSEPTSAMKTAVARVPRHHRPATFVTHATENDQMRDDLDAAILLPGIPVMKSKKGIEARLTQSPVNP